MSERQTFVQLFGPVQNEGAIIQTHVASYGFAGAATSTSCKKFWFNRAWKQITWCALHIEYTPNAQANCIQLFDCDDGPSNFHQIAEVAGIVNPNPWAVAIGITAEMQALAAAGLPKNIGFRIRGDGATLMAIYQIYLEILETESGGGGAMTQTQWNAMAKVAVNSIP